MSSINNEKDNARKGFHKGVKESHNEQDALVTSVKKDLSEHKRAGKKLTISETRYRRLFEAAKDGILILDSESGMIMDVNPFLINLLGYSKDQFAPKFDW
jgi:PAS domain-containing protein